MTAEPSRRAVAAVATPPAPTSRSLVVTAAVTGLLGGLLFAWAAGARVLDPREFGWVMRGDWQNHFLGWHFFRHQPWQWPPGMIPGLHEPVGTSVGYMDAIPLAAFLLKPIEAWLPNPFQYLGLWFLTCFALQGFFGSLAVSTWTPRPVLQVMGGLLIVLMPTLFYRVAHPALCSHWLLLWALWLHWRGPAAFCNDIAHHMALALTAGLIHPYLAVMTFALIAALGLHRLTGHGGVSRLQACASLGIATSALLCGWWASGLFTVSTVEDLRAGLGVFSMNLASPFNPGSNSTFIPGFRLLAASQGEGYQYLGLGVLLLCVAAGVVGLRRPHRPRPSMSLLLALAACALYSISPVIAFGPFLLVDLQDQLGGASVFRTTGRFFWPVAYALTVSVIGVTATRFTPRLATALVIGAFVLQVADLQQWWWRVHDGARSEAFHHWNDVMPSTEWDELLPRYRRVRLYLPVICGGPEPVPPTAAAYHAGLHGLTINDGVTSRFDSVKRADACRELHEDLALGRLDDATVYVLSPSLVADFRASAGALAQCREIDKLTVCVRRQR